MEHRPEPEEYEVVAAVEAGEPELRGPGRSVRSPSVILNLALAPVAVVAV